MFLLVSFFLLATTVFPQAKTIMIPTFAGPYISYADKVYPCLVDGQQTASQLKMRATHFNPVRPWQKQNVTGFFNMTAPLDDSWACVADMAVRSNNQWKEHAFIFKSPNNGCSNFRANAPDLFRLLMEKLGNGYDKKRECFAPAGLYEFKNEPVAWEFPNFPIMPYGYYRFHSLITSKGGTISQLCLQIEWHIIPKPA